MTKIEDNSEDESKTHKLQICYNIIKGAYDFSIENRTNLDEKASKIIIFSGIIFSVYSGIGGIFLKDLSKTDAFIINKYDVLVIALFIGIISLISSIILALRAYKPEIWENVPSAKGFHEKYVKNDEDEDLIFSKLSASIVVAIQNNNDKLNKKAKYIQYAYIVLQVGIIACALFALIAII